MPEILIVHNPVAGTSEAEYVKQVFDRQFSSQGIIYNRHETKRQPAQEIGKSIRAAVQRGVDMVLAAGGDGTVSAVANALVNTAVPMGIIPLGSGNTLARGLGIPLDLNESLELITGDHTIRSLDTIVAGSDHFLLNLSIGLSARVVADTKRRQKRRFGKAAYALQSLQNLAGLRRHKYFLTIDGLKITARASEVYVANAGLVGFKALRLSPEIKPDDGILHVCILSARTLVELVRLLLDALRGNPESRPELNCIAAKKEILIDSNAPRPVQGDGELISETPLKVGIAPASIDMIVPAKA
jgi:YegS/Rv2252/BmrU family lipid kinase